MVEIKVQNCDGSEYVLFPACAYNGNKFDVIKRKYSPRFLPSEARIDMPVTITDMPRLNKDGTSKIEVTTGDVATPCVGVFCPEAKYAVLVFTVQEIDGKNIGLAYERGKITLTYPARREYVYKYASSDTGEFMWKNDEEYIEIEKEIPHKIIDFECDNIETFFKTYFENRKRMGLDSTRPKVLSLKEQFEIQREKFNNMNWKEDGGFYDIDTKGQWQPGWCGGAMAGYPLMKLGGELEKERAIKTLEHLFKNQSPSGLFYGYSKEKNDAHFVKGAENWVLIRKSADCLYFLFKYFEIMDYIPPHFIDGTRRLADAFVKIWEKYGQFGQYIDCNTGEIAVGGSTSGAIIPAGLVGAYKYFGDEKYLEVAENSALYMYKNYALKGYTTGGPGDALQCPDSESAYALFESMAVLYEETKKPEYLSFAEYLAHFFSSWVVSYNYRFPKDSEFYRLGMKTVGSVFANVQNKHSAPGICTHSPIYLYKLYKWTGTPLYKELFEDIALTASQYMSTNERPIYSWNLYGEKPSKLPQGFICERVNMSDWESEKGVGEVFCGSCWCEVSNLLTIADLAQIGGYL